MRCSTPVTVPVLLARLRTWMCLITAVCVFALASEAQFVSIAQAQPPAEPLVDEMATLRTPWADKLNPQAPLPEYPRPQLARPALDAPAWTNLNGQWDYAIRPAGMPVPGAFDGLITVPFCAESQLSGVQKRVNLDQTLWYHRTFATPRTPAGGRVLLHFGAVDWFCEVTVNGQVVGDHRGGYDPFTFDITTALRSDGDNKLVVRVTDPTSTKPIPRGKQRLDPRGIWYTPVTGIWQTVWLESVPATSISSLKITPDVDASHVTITPVLRGGAGNERIDILVKDGQQTIAQAQTTDGKAAVLKLPGQHLWSPADPFLYSVVVEVAAEAGAADRVESYFGQRKTSIVKDDAGHLRMAHNNEVLFHFGPLDQGWWPDGLYTAPTDEALKFDIEATRDMGFNMIRKHVKVEPARWYYWCDKLGLLVWQDMPSAMALGGDSEHVKPEDAKDLVRQPADSAQFEAELKAMIDALYNQPCIVMWVPFNEGWGQYDTQRITDWTKQYDPSRLVNNPSGWTDRGLSDIYDVHNYPGPAIEPGKGTRVAVLGEFGGLGWPVPEHLWGSNRNWGYRTYQSQEELIARYTHVLESLAGLTSQGMSAAVYTQTTDVEGEVNGLLTYDRKVIKLPARVTVPLARKLYEPPGTWTPILESSATNETPWSLRREVPVSAAWRDAGFDDSGWEKQSGGFAPGPHPHMVVRGEWKGPDIWLRKSFDTTVAAKDLWLMLYYDAETVTVSLNGEEVFTETGMGSSYLHYRHIRLKNAGQLLKPTGNVLAIHAQKKGNAKAIDAGLYAVDGQ